MKDAGSSLRATHPVLAWDDPAAFVAVAEPHGKRIAVHGDGGGLALALAAAGAARVVVVGDTATRATADLLRAALEELRGDAVAAFLGLGEGGRRLYHYHLVRPRLLPEHRAWWDAREATLRRGLVNDDPRVVLARSFRATLGALGGLARVHPPRRRIAAAWLATRAPRATAAHLTERTVALWEAGPSPLLRWLLRGEPGDLVALVPILAEPDAASAAGRVGVGGAMGDDGPFDLHVVLSGTVDPAVPSVVSSDAPDVRATATVPLCGLGHRFVVRRDPLPQEVPASSATL